uniref:Nudix hydrolase domain-containing protein n=1 Tax=Parastrongyloides trichosuri TaxID=131310 RepID=A0A0N4ZFV8_PARTI
MNNNTSSGSSYHLMFNNKNGIKVDDEGMKIDCCDKNKKDTTNMNDNNGERIRDRYGYRLRAAGVVMLPGDNPCDPNILLVSGIKNPSNLVIPGGGIEKEEDASEAALREVKEEAGVECDILWSVGEFKVIIYLFND